MAFIDTDYFHWIPLNPLIITFVYIVASFLVLFLLGKYFKASYEWPFLCTLSIKVAPAYSTYIDLAAKDYVATTQVFCFSASILRESDWCVLLAGSTYSILFLRSNANSPKWIYTVGLWVVAKPPHSLLVLLLYTYLAYIALYIIPICTFREYVSTRRS